jgi:nicotinate dehydrogenase subunit B
MNPGIPVAKTSRRAVLAGGGALVIGFSLVPRLHAQSASEAGPALPSSLGKTPMLDSWIRIDSDGAITVFTGKAELGQGLKTALAQIAAEELIVAPEAIRLVTADTALTPDEGYTAGSHSIDNSGTAIRHAAAQARALLIGAAAARLQLPPERLRAEGGMVAGDDGRQIGYGELVGDRLLQIRAEPQSSLVDPAQHRWVGKPVPRVDIPAKLTGGAAFVQDLRLPNMVHGRVVRPPSYAARLRRVDGAAAERMPGVLKTLRDGSYLAVIAEREYQAVAAMRALAAAAEWDEQSGLPDPASLFDTLAALPAQNVTVRDGSGDMPADTKIIEASYRRAYQMHGSIGPSCAVGRFADGGLTVWTHSQGVFPLRAALAELTGLAPDKVRCVHLEGAGCYGHNGADDAAADAALLALALPGRPVRVQWMRDDEHSWEPYGPAMLTRARAALDTDGRIVAWDYTVRSNTHSTRPGGGPGGAGNLIAAWHRARAIAQPAPRPIPLPVGGGHRNAAPLYTIPNPRVTYEFVPEMTFIDELARAARADPVDFRLRHLDDPRAREVVGTAAARFGWSAFDRQYGRGRGFGFARYKNLAAYLAVAVEVAVDRESGRVRLIRAVAAVDSGEAVNPDGIKNQVEGGILQSASWTLYESVAFDRTRITSRDWGSYPILRFKAVPDTVEVYVIDRPGSPFLGTGEAAQGPTAAAIANAVADAADVRLREVPLTAARVKAAIGV